MMKDNLHTKVDLENGSPAFAKPVLGEGAVIGWWSGGITSAVACRLAIAKYPNVRLVYIETGSHHPDTMRFKADCEKWYGKKLKPYKTRSTKTI